MPRLTILGCGTSGGVPKAPEFWGDCDPQEPKNRRSRASVMVEEGGKTFIIDTSPDLRSQALACGLKQIDAVFYTHDHADHCHGIDDLRGFMHSRDGVPVPIYADPATLDELKHRFRYIFVDQEGYRAIADGRYMQPGKHRVGGCDVTMFAQKHGVMNSYGFRFGSVAYSTDLNALDEQAFDALSGVDIWVVDALRRQPHPTHAHLDLTLSWIDRVKPKLAVLTHMDWSMDYHRLSQELPNGVVPAFDGMVLDSEIAGFGCDG